MSLPFTMMQVPCIALCLLSDATLDRLQNDLCPGTGLVAPHDNDFFLTVPGDETQAEAPADDQRIVFFFDN